ncbi:diguanylate cyclase domain-containing protein [Baaleninema sp.]|uniref:diguanylate cyclase domain-containing protein n=1 Tax=Baaleninema sp. TaxID=3101197 RepID=UPI003D07C960
MSDLVTDPGHLLYRITQCIRQSFARAERNSTVASHREQLLPQIFKTCVEEIQEFLKVDRVNLYRFDADGSGVVVAESTAPEGLPALLGLHFPPEDIPPATRVQLTQIRQSLVADLGSGRKTLFRGPFENRNDTPSNPEDEERAIDPCHVEYLKAMGVAATLTVPLLYRNQLWGLLNVHHRQPREFSRLELQTVQLVVDRIAIAVAQSELRFTTEQQIRQESALERIATLLNQDRGGSECQQKILAVAIDALNSCGGRLYLCANPTDSSGQLYRYGDEAACSALETDPRWREIFLNLNPPTSEDFNLAPRIFNAENWTTQTELSLLNDAFAETPIRSVLVVPLQYQSQCVGYLSLFRRGEDTEIWWAGQSNPEATVDRPRASFEAWREFKKAQVPVWDNEDLKLARTIAIHLYVAVVQQRLSAMLHYQVSHDPLTHLPNRFLFDERLSLALLEAQHRDRAIAVGFLDIDRFKAINDSFGHSVGDRLLKEISKRLLNSLQEDDFLGRWGGDELIFIFGPTSCHQGIAQVAQRVLETLRAPFDLNGRELYVTASLGIAIAPNDGQDAPSLLQNADAAMAWAKKQGKNNYQIYSSDMGEANADLLGLEIELRKAISRHEFFLQYQPQIDLGSGSIVGVEALVRWQHDRLGLVSPGQFIPIAEETGDICALGEWVLRTACQQHRAWVEAGFPPIKMAVNLSARQFQQPDLVRSIVAILDETEMNASYLEIEITETTAVKNLDLTVGVLQKLRQMGIQIAMDDFGTGYSCLSFIKQFPLDTLKIDRSFVRDLTRDPSDAAIAKTIVALGQGLNLIVLAEGVETTEQLEFLKSIHCDLVQGYLFSRPVTADKVPQLFHHWPVFRGIEKVPVRRRHLPADLDSPKSREPVSGNLRQRVRELEAENEQLNEKLQQLDRTSQLLNRKLRQFRQLARLSQEAASGKSLEQLAELAAVSIRRGLNVDLALVYRYDGDENPLVLSQSSRDATIAVWDFPLAAPTLDPFVETLSLDSVSASRVKADEAALLSSYGVRASLVASIRSRERVWGGAIAHQCFEPRPWTKDDRKWLQQMTEVLSVALADEKGFKPVSFNLDPISQLADRQSFELRLAREWQRLQATRSSLSVVMGQIDRWRYYRQLYGDRACDRCLSAIADLWRSRLSLSGSAIARYDDLTFAVLLPYFDSQQAIAVAEDLRGSLRTLALPHSAPSLDCTVSSSYVTLSLGVATGVGNGTSQPKVLLEAAQTALNRAKSEGGDRVVLQACYDLGSKRQGGEAIG